MTRGSKLVGGLWDATVEVWKCGGGNFAKEPLHFYELEEAVQCCDVLSDNISPVAAAGASDGSLSILDFRAQNVVCMIHNHTDSVTSVRLRKDISRLLTANRDLSLLLLLCSSWGSNENNDANEMKDASTMIHSMATYIPDITPLLLERFWNVFF